MNTSFCDSNNCDIQQYKYKNCCHYIVPFSPSFSFLSNIYVFVYIFCLSIYYYYFVINHLNKKDTWLQANKLTININKTNYYCFLSSKVK